MPTCGTLSRMASDAITVKFDIAPILRALSSMVRKQVPYAISQALNQTAFDARAHLQAHLGDSFTIRNTFTARGLRVEKATKTNHEAAVGSVRDYMKLQEEGGKKVAHSKAMAVPITPAKQRKTTTPKSKWPGALLKRSGYFIAKSDKGTPVLYRRKTEGHDAPLEPIFRFTRKVYVPPRWHLRDEVGKIVHEKWEKNAFDALTKAIKSAK